ncbi:MAG: response regulator [Candidatus Riflebacteria bacterium]|nr:response regulator [Candidatus Riflebacteria bacterium]
MEKKREKLRVLIVENDEISRMLLSSMVREIGHECKTATNGADGFKVFQSFKPDLIFTEISLPGVDGLAMLEQIRRESQKAIVVILTGQNSPEVILKVLPLHANDFLLKPITPNGFRFYLQKMEDVIANRSEEEEIIGMILHRELTLKIGNLPMLVGKVADLLVRETESLLPAENRWGIRLGLVEIILNAIEHGNLGLSFDEKTKAQEGEPEKWARLISQRSGIEPYNTRHVLIQFRLENDWCEWMISDEGEGFDWTKVPDPTAPENFLCSHGRGILLTKISFDEVKFIGKGNQVVLQKRINRQV